MASTGALPDARAAHGSAWDDVEQRLFIGGGRAASDAPQDLNVWHAAAGPAGSWTSLDPTQGPPDGGAAPSWAWDPIAERLLQVGGRVPNDLLLEPQSVSFIDGLPGDWLGLAPSGPVPPPQTAASLVFDADGYAIWLIGGTTHHDLIDGMWQLAF